MIDKILGIPYRIIGVVMFIILIVTGIPVILIPTYLTACGRASIKEAKEIGLAEFNGASLGEVTNWLRESGTILGLLAAFYIEKILLSLCMIITGLWYEEMYTEVVNEPLD